MESPTLITFTGYFLVLCAIGFAAWRATRTAEDYILGGRRLGPAVTALSAGASDMSGWLLLGLPGAVYLAGIRRSGRPWARAVALVSAPLIVAFWLYRLGSWPG